VPVGGGSAEFVNANGVLVTDDATVVADHAATVRRGVNLAFHDLYGVPLPADPSAEVEIADESLHHRLHDCYDETPDADCAVFPTLSTHVSPYVTSPTPEGQPATVIDTPGPLALLRTGGANNPTEAIAGSGPTNEQSVVVLAFPGPVESGGKPTSIGTHVTVQGDDVSLDDAEMIRDELKNGWAGAAVADLNTGQLVGLIAGDFAAPHRVIPASAVTAALRSVPIQPLRSAADSDYAGALDYFFAHHYSHSINDFHAVLRLNPQHALAAVHLQQSRDLAGKPGDLSATDDQHPMSDPSSSGTFWKIAVAVLVVLAVALAALLLLLRRRRGGESGPAPAGTGGAPFGTPASSTAMRLRTGARRLVGMAPPGPASRSRDVGDGHRPADPGPNGAFRGPADHTAPPTRVLDAGAFGAPAQGDGQAAAARQPVGVGAGERTRESSPAGRPGRESPSRPGAQVFCEHCGSDLGPSARFCGQCATPVRR
jgi:hypothetical protein